MAHRTGEEKRILQIIGGTPLVSIDLVIRNSKGEVLLGKRVNRPAQGNLVRPRGQDPEE
jgi:colanic acid biosynthesis protein WcaH